MRIGEALRLTLQDVDLAEKLITVRDTKFFKTRYVPFGTRLGKELAGHLQRRRCFPMIQGERSPFFTTHNGQPWRYTRVISLFQRIREEAGITCPIGELRPPRLHDIRHTSAVHRMLSWYQSGQDVQQLLPRLSTYLGHVDIRSTQRYLHMTPELLEAASQRYAQYARGADYEG